MRVVLGLIFAVAAAAQGSEPCPRAPVGTLYEQGVWHATQGRPDCAVTPFEQAIREAPGNADRLSSLGAVLVRLRRFAEAQSALEKAASIAPTSVFVLDYLAQAYSAQGLHVQAVNALRAAVRADPANIDMRLALAEALYADGQDDASLRTLESAARDYHRDPRVGAALDKLNETIARRASSQPAFRLLAEKRWTEAAASFRQALTQEPANARLMTGLGQALVQMRQLEEAAGVFERVTALEPRSAAAWMNVGSVLGDLSRHGDALECFRKAAQMEPRLAAAHRSVGRALLDLKRPSEAKAPLLRAVSLAPKDADAALLLGSVYARLEQPQQALLHLRKVLAANPDHLVANQEAGRALIALGQAQQGIAALRKALEKNPSDSIAAYALLRALAATRSTEAAAASDRVREIQGHQAVLTRARVLSNFALGESKAKNWPAALRHAREAIAVCGACPAAADLQRNLGLYLAESGDIEAARTSLLEAARLKPDDQDIKYAVRLVGQWKQHGGP